MARKLHVDQDECISCESCLEIAPAAFAMDENETAYVTDYEGESGDVIREAVDACPVECIHWEN